MGEVVKQILLIDADDTRRTALRQMAEKSSGRQVSLCSPHEWRYRIEKGDGIDALLLGPCPGTDVQLRIYRAVRESRPFLPVLLYHGKGGVLLLDREEAAGSYVEVFEWPASEQTLSTLLQRALSYAQSQQPAVERSPELFRALVGKSDGIAKVRDLIEHVSNSEVPALILGEPGTGKEVVARNLHYHSPRRGRSFVAISCDDNAADVLERELFGNAKSSESNNGCVDAADGGTLFIDEIGDLTPELQVKVLRLIKDGSYERAGGTRMERANVRIMGATSRDIDADIKHGRFRKDLYDALNVITLRVPPLRHRGEDLSLLVGELNARLIRERSFGVRLSPAVLQALRRYRWPGNVRELSNLIERLAVLHPNKTIELADLPANYRSSAPTESAGAAQDATAITLPPEGMDLKEFMNQLEYSLITQALNQTGGVVAHAATLLKLPRTTLIEKLRKYGVRSEPPVALVAEK